MTCHTVVISQEQRLITGSYCVARHAASRTIPARIVASEEMLMTSLVYAPQAGNFCQFLTLCVLANSRNRRLVAHQARPRAVQALDSSDAVLDPRHGDITAFRAVAAHFVATDTTDSQKAGTKADASESCDISHLEPI